MDYWGSSLREVEVSDTLTEKGKTKEDTVFDTVGGDKVDSFIEEYESQKVYEQF